MILITLTTLSTLSTLMILMILMIVVGGSYRFSLLVGDALLTG